MSEYRIFTDSHGITWRVYRIEPSSVSPALQRLRDTLPLRHDERRRPWLLFEADTGERRRLVPVPDGWDEADGDRRLEQWCEGADHVPPAPEQRRDDREQRPTS